MHLFPFQAYFGNVPGFRNVVGKVVMVVSGRKDMTMRFEPVQER
jgi:hypothetical protein